MTKVSFIIPVYNAAPFIERCLNSIFSLRLPEEQTEIICVDDCSQDGSAAIIEAYRQKRLASEGVTINEEQNSLITNSLIPNRCNLRLIKHEKNGRQGAARNTGIRNAQGKYCVFVDADDTLPNVDLFGLIEYMRQNDLELLLGRANVIAADGSIGKWGQAPDEESSIMSGPDIYVDEYIHKLGFGVVWMGIYKTELVRRIPPFLENVQYEDTDWTLRCAYEAKRLQYRPVILYNYHVNQETTTTAKSVGKLIERTKQALRIYEWAVSTKERHDEVVFAAEDYGTWNLHGIAGLVKYGFRDRSRFYKSFSRKELRTITRWWGGNYTKLYVRFPILSQVALCVLHPIYRIYKRICLMCDV